MTASCQPAIHALSQELRDQTAASHHDVERSLGLPHSITSVAQYRTCLERFYRLYRPLEVSVGRFSEWADLGLDLSSVHSEWRHAAALAVDLAALGIDPAGLEPAQESALPLLPDFAHALGALYVTQGSTLGSQFILRHLRETLGEQIAGAATFFLGSGARTFALWSDFQGRLDRYGHQHPADTEGVVEGARATFAAIGAWMQV